MVNDSTDFPLACLRESLYRGGIESSTLEVGRRDQWYDANMLKSAIDVDPRRNSPNTRRLLQR